MITFAALVPHPPLLIPEIGAENTLEVAATTKAMKILAGNISESDPETVIIISPHGNLSPETFTVGLAPYFAGNFSDFDAPEVSLSFPGDIELASAIIKEAGKAELAAAPQIHNDKTYNLDHGALVPLYFLTEDLSPKTKIVTIGYSYLGRAEHFSFGQAIKQAVEKSGKRVAIIASGDLSHKHLNNQFGNKEAPEQFDDAIKSGIEKKNFESLIYLSEDLRYDAGECGYRSLLILLGAIDGLKVSPKVLSAEHPFGVGYLVADFGVEE